MEVIKSGSAGALSPLEQSFPVDCIVAGDSVLKVPAHATAYGYVITGTLISQGVEHQEGEYFTSPALSTLQVVTGTSVIFLRHGFRGQRCFGGVVEGHGRAQEAHQRIHTTNLVVRHTPNDPGFASKHLSRSAKVDVETGPVPHFCVLVEGSMKITAPQVGQTLQQGDVFVLDAWETYKIQSGDKPAVYLSFEAIVRSEI
jgi:hypothetical protein